MMDTPLGEIPTPLVASMASAGSNQQGNSGPQAGLLNSAIPPS